MAGSPLDAPDKPRRFGWRDALAYARAVPRVALKRPGSIPHTALARMWAMDTRRLPGRRLFEASDHGRIAYRTYESASAVNLILVHGSACFGDQLHRMASHIAGQGLATVHTLDMRGHGGSGPAPDHPDRFAKDIGEFVTALRATRRPSAIVLGGHSAGGGLVLNALRSPYLSGISGCLLFAPFLAIDSPSVRPFFGGWAARLYRRRLVLAIAANLLGSRRFNSLTIARFDSEAVIHDPRYAREWSFDTVFGFGPGPAGSGPLPDMPVLLAAGTADDCFRAEYYEQDLARITPRGEVVLFEGLGHWDVLTDAAALDLYAAWLGRHFAQGRAADADRRQLA